MNEIPMSSASVSLQEKLKPAVIPMDQISTVSGTASSPQDNESHYMMTYHSAGTNGRAYWVQVVGEKDGSTEDPLKPAETAVLIHNLLIDHGFLSSLVGLEFNKPLNQWLAQNTTVRQIAKQGHAAFALISQYLPETWNPVSDPERPQWLLSLSKAEREKAEATLLRAAALLDENHYYVNDPQILLLPNGTVLFTQLDTYTPNSRLKNDFSKIIRAIHGLDTL